MSDITVVGLIRDNGYLKFPVLQPRQLHACKQNLTLFWTPCEGKSVSSVNNPHYAFVQRVAADFFSLGPYQCVSVRLEMRLRSAKMTRGGF